MLTTSLKEQNIWAQMEPYENALFSYGDAYQIIPPLSEEASIYDNHTEERGGIRRAHKGGCMKV